MGFDLLLSLKEMFYNCLSLEKVSYSFETYTVSNIEKMFYKCSSLTKIDLKVFENTENAQSMDEMFYYCNKLTSIDISTFTTSLTSIKLFNELPSKGKIIVKQKFLSLIKDQIINYINNILQILHVIKFCIYKNITYK